MLLLMTNNNGGLLTRVAPLSLLDIVWLGNVVWRRARPSDVVHNHLLSCGVSAVERPVHGST